MPNDNHKSEETAPKAEPWPDDWVEPSRCPNCRSLGRTPGCYMCFGDAMDSDDYRAMGARVPR